MQSSVINPDYEQYITRAKKFISQGNCKSAQYLIENIPKHIRYCLPKEIQEFILIVDMMMQLFAAQYDWEPSITGEISKEAAKRNIPEGERAIFALKFLLNASRLCEVAKFSVELAFSAYIRGDYTDAICELNDAIRDAAQGYYMQSLEYYAAHELNAYWLRAGLAWVEKAIELAPQHPEYQAHRDELLEHLKNYPISPAAESVAEAYNDFAEDILSFDNPLPHLEYARRALIQAIAFNLLSDYSFNLASICIITGDLEQADKYHKEAMPFDVCGYYEFRIPRIKSEVRENKEDDYEPASEVDLQDLDYCDGLAALCKRDTVSARNHFQKLADTHVQWLAANVLSDLIDLNTQSPLNLSKYTLKQLREIIGSKFSEGNLYMDFTTAFSSREKAYTLWQSMVSAVEARITALEQALSILPKDHDQRKTIEEIPLTQAKMKFAEQSKILWHDKIQQYGHIALALSDAVEGNYLSATNRLAKDDYFVGYVGIGKIQLWYIRDKFYEMHNDIPGRISAFASVWPTLTMNSHLNKNIQKISTLIRLIIKNHIKLDDDHVLHPLTLARYIATRFHQDNILETLFNLLADINFMLPKQHPLFSGNPAVNASQDLIYALHRKLGVRYVETKAKVVWLGLMHPDTFLGILLQRPQEHIRGLKEDTIKAEHFSLGVAALTDLSSLETLLSLSKPFLSRCSNESHQSLAQKLMSIPSDNPEQDAKKFKVLAEIICARVTSFDNTIQKQEVLWKALTGSATFFGALFSADQRKLMSEYLHQLLSTGVFTETEMDAETHLAFTLDLMSAKNTPLEKYVRQHCGWSEDLSLSSASSLMLFATERRPKAPEQNGSLQPPRPKQ